MNASPFILFGNLHLLTMALIIFTAVFLPLKCKNLSGSNKSIMSKVIACVILAHVVISPYTIYTYLKILIIGKKSFHYTCVIYLKYF